MGTARGTMTNDTYMGERLLEAAAGVDGGDVKFGLHLSLTTALPPYGKRLHVARVIP